MFLANNCTCAVYFTSAAHVQLLAKNMAATHAITKTPYAFFAKIILCMYLPYACMLNIAYTHASAYSFSYFLLLYAT